MGQQKNIRGKVYVGILVDNLNLSFPQLVEISPGTLSNIQGKGLQFLKVVYLSQLPSFLKKFVILQYVQEIYSLPINIRTSNLSFSFYPYEGYVSLQLYSLGSKETEEVSYHLVEFILITDFSH